MANIYKEGAEELHSLLSRAGDPQGISVLVPDLQRPYVWQPDQVVLLVDSLIRGWPFGTLLMWKVRGDELSTIPSRGFWSRVDRLHPQNSASLGKAIPPTNFQMVLDGQQRLQSLLLALCGDDWGFLLADVDWHEALTGERPRGRAPKQPHWSKGSLCFDLYRFAEEYARGGQSLVSVDFRKVLRWAVVDPSTGRSDFRRPDNYAVPLENAFELPNSARLIRLSRLWSIASADANLKERHFRERLIPLLDQHGVSKQEQGDLLSPLAELLSAFRDLKLSKVTYLELQDFVPEHWAGAASAAGAGVKPRDSYNEAIVSIFTRLNTAGRTLTSEEITLAWLKVEWDKSQTDEKLAGECFQDLLSAMSGAGLHLSIDDLVSAVSMTWAVVTGKGQPVTKADLLKGEVTRPMAKNICQRWADISAAFIRTAELLDARDLRFGIRAQVSSLNALSLLATWVYIAEQWRRQSSLNEAQRDAFDKRCLASMHQFVDRWAISSQWGSTWAQSAAYKTTEFMKGLTELVEEMAEHTNLESAHLVWSACMNEFVNSFADEAANFVKTVVAESRERVSIYRNLLWVWHRLDAERWKMSRIPLRAMKKGTTTDVDHAVSFDLWESRLQSDPRADLTDDSEADLQVINSLGNCALLEKNFNISKSNRTLLAFLRDVHEISEKHYSVVEWAAPLGLTPEMIDPLSFSKNAVAESIAVRDISVRQELEAFVRGQRIRADVDLGLALVAKPSIPALESSAALE